MKDLLQELTNDEVQYELYLEKIGREFTNRRR